MGIIEAVKNGFAQAWQLKQVVLVVIIVNFVMFIVGFGAVGSVVNPAELTGEAPPENLGALWGILGIVVIINFLVSAFLIGGILGCGKEAIKTGSSSLSNILGYCKQYFVRILGLFVINAIIVAVVLLVLGLLVTIISLPNIAVLSAIAGIVATIVFLAVVFLLSYVFPALPVVVDELGAVDALKKGIQVAKENYVKTIGLVVLAGVILIVFGMIQQGVLGAINQAGIIALGVIFGVIFFVIQTYIQVSVLYALMNYYIGLTGGASSQGAQQAQPQGPAMA